MSASSAHQGMIARLPNDWASVTVGELGNVVGGSTPSRDSSHFWGGSYPWVTPGELTSLGAKHVQATREAITRAGLDSCGARLVPVNTLLVTSRATLGSVALAGRELCTNQGFKSVILGSSASPDFYFHLFKTLTSELERRASGTTFLEVSGREFSAVVVPQPPLPEQRQIAAILDTIDDAIRKTEQIIAKLKQVKQGLLHDLLTRGIDDNGELRDPERHPEQFKDSPLGRIPREWEVAPLGTVSHVRYGVNDAIDQSLTDGVATITLPCVSAEGDLTLNDVVWTAPHKVGEALLLQPGDLLFNWRNGSINHLGKTAFFSGEHGVPMTHVGFLLRVRADRERAKPSFLWHELRHLKECGVFLRAKLQVNNTFNSEELRALEVVCPPLHEQQAIALALDLLEERAKRHRQETEKLRLLKAGLMEDLLTGRVRVTSLLAEMQP